MAADSSRHYRILPLKKLGLVCAPRLVRTVRDTVSPFFSSPAPAPPGSFVRFLRGGGDNKKYLVGVCGWRTRAMDGCGKWVVSQRAGG